MKSFHDGIHTQGIQHKMWIAIGGLSYLRAHYPGGSEAINKWDVALRSASLSGEICKLASKVLGEEDGR